MLNELHTGSIVLNDTVVQRSLTVSTKHKVFYLEHNLTQSARCIACYSRSSASLRSAEGPSKARRYYSGALVCLHAGGLRYTFRERRLYSAHGTLFILNRIKI